jgi:hypothetical protein
VNQKINFIICLLLFWTSAFAANLLKNPDFVIKNSKVNFPEDWFFGKFRQAVGQAVVDDKNTKSGKHSVRLHLKSSKKNGFIALNTTVVLGDQDIAKEYLFKIQASANDLKYGSIVIIGQDKQKKHIQWENIKNFSGSFDWKTISCKFKIKAKVKYLTVSIRVIHPGILWIDNCSLTEFQSNSAKDVNQVVNSSFVGPIMKPADLPSGWLKYASNGLEAIGNVEISGSNSNNERELLLTWIDGGKIVGAEALLKNNVPQKNCSLQATALTKTSNGGKGVLCLEFFDFQGKLLNKYFSSPVSSSKWADVKLKITPPAHAAQMRMYCFNRGTGQVHFKNVSLKNIYGTATQKSFPFQAYCPSLENSKIWNKGVPQFNTFSNSPIPLGFCFKKCGKIKNPVFIIEFPEKVKIVDAFSPHPGFYKAEQPIATKVTRPEGKYIRYRFEKSNTFAILQTQYSYQRKLIMGLMPENNQPLKELIVFWRLENDGIKTAEKHFYLNFLKPLPDLKRPKSFCGLKWSCHDYEFSKNDVLNMAATAMENCNMAYMQRFNFKRGREIDSLLGARNWKFYFTFPDTSYVIFGPPQKDKGKIEYSIKINGEKDKRRYCPEYMLDDQQFRNSYTNFLKERLQKVDLKPGDIVITDLEPWHPMDWCFCNRCCKKFAKKYGLKSIVSPLDIIKNHAKQWTEFRCENTKEHLKIYTGIMRKYFPGSFLGDYSYPVPYHRDNFAWMFSAVARDPEINEPYIDINFPSYYHNIDKQAFDLLEVNRKHLKKTIMPVIGLDAPGGFLVEEEVMAPNQVRLFLLAAALNGCSGFTIYPGEQIDGKYYAAINQAMNSIQKYEDLIKKSSECLDKCSITALPFSKIKIKTAGKDIFINKPRWHDFLAYKSYRINKFQTLLAIFNYNKKYVMFADVKLQMPAGNYYILNQTNQQLIVPSGTRKTWTHKELQNGVLMQINKADVAFIKIINSKKAVASELPVQKLSRKDINKAFKNVCKRFNSSKNKKEAFKIPVAKDSMSIGYSDKNNDGIPELQIKTPVQTIFLETCEAYVVDWKCSNEFLSKTINCTKLRIAQDSLWIPRLNSKELYHLKNAEIKKDFCIVTFEKEIKKTNLIISKTFKFSKTSSAFLLSCNLKNNGTEEQKISLWIKNLFSVNKADNSTNTITFTNIQNGIEEKVKTSSHGESVFVLNNASVNGFLPQKVQGKISTGLSSMQIKDNGKINVTVEDKKLMQYYYWYNSLQAYTWEWMYRPTVISPGQQWETSIKYQYNSAL